jgi:hypothetical protein
MRKYMSSTVHHLDTREGKWKHGATPRETLCIYPITFTEAAPFRPIVYLLLGI